jgi:hypothetical protein
MSKNVKARRAEILQKVAELDKQDKEQGDELGHEFTKRLIGMGYKGSDVGYEARWITHSLTSHLEKTIRNTVARIKLEEEYEALA